MSGAIGGLPHGVHCQLPRLTSASMFPRGWMCTTDVYPQVLAPLLANHVPDSHRPPVLTISFPTRTPPKYALSGAEKPRPPACPAAAPSVANEQLQGATTHAGVPCVTHITAMRMRSHNLQMTSE